MAQRIKTFFSNNWVVTIGGGTISGLLILIIVDFYNKTPILTSVKWVFQHLVSFTTLILNYQIKIWWLLLLFLISYILIRIYSSYINSNTSEKEISQDKMDKILKYKADKFLNFTWEWQWILNEKINDYEIKKIRPCCPHPECKYTHMDFDHQSYTSFIYICPKCCERTEVRTSIFGSINDLIELKILEKAKTL